MEEQQIIRLIFLGLSFIIFTGYLIYCYIKHGFTKTFSVTYYYNDLKYLFTFTLILMSLFLALSGNTFLFYMAFFCISSVGIYAQYRRSNNKSSIHVVNAIIGIVLGFLSLLVNYQLYYIVSIGVFINLLFYLFNIKNKIYWIEVISYYVIVVGILFNIFV